MHVHSKNVEHILLRTTPQPLALPGGAPQVLHAGLVGSTSPKDLGTTVHFGLAARA